MTAAAASAAFSTASLAMQAGASADAIAANPTAAIQGHWLGSSGEATRPDPYEMDIRGNQIIVTHVRDATSYISLRRVGELQAEILGVAKMSPSGDGRTWIHNNGRCWSSHANDFRSCTITVTVNSSYQNAPRGSVTVELGGTQIKLYRSAHLAKLKQSYSPSFRSWD